MGKRTESAASADDAYRRFGPALVRKADRLLRSHDDALDIVQSVFVDAAAGRVRYLDLPYLYRTVTNRCLNFLRDRKNRERLLRERGDAAEPQRRTTLDDRIVDLDTVIRLLGRLDDKSLQVLVMHFFDDMDQVEISRTLGISRRGVVKRLAVAKRRCRDILDSRAQQGAL